MTGLKTVIKYEFKKLAGGDRNELWVYAVISLVWSFALVFRSAGVSDLPWLVFFPVFIAANFSSAAFISERISGTLEVLITSGLSRDAVLFGKMVFVVAMTLAMGGVCVAFGAAFAVWPLDAVALLSFGVNDALLYLSVAVFNAAASAYLSVRLAAPRFLHFINLLMVSVIVAVYGALSALFAVHPLLLALAFTSIGIIFIILARRKFAGEWIVRPINF